MSEPEPPGPVLVPVGRGSSRPDAAVLVLHGGASRHQATPVSPRQLSVVRMVPVARRVAHDGRGRLRVFRLLNGVRGWDATRSPVDDVAWALDRLREEILPGPLPVALVGHSLGGRAALLSAARPGVRAVVALNPWVYDTDADALSIPADRRMLVVHGDRDRIASPERSAAVTATLRRTLPAGAVGRVVVRGGKHAMLRRGRTFERVASDFVRAVLLGDRVGAPVNDVLDGALDVEV